MTELSSEIKARIENYINENQIMLFMKGTKDHPECGFSAQVVQILNQYGVEYNTENILADWDLREDKAIFKLANNSTALC